MSILTDANLYLELETWAENFVNNCGEHAARKTLKGMYSVIDSLKSKSSRTRKEEKDLLKLEDVSTMLSRAIEQKRMRDFTAPGREAIKEVKKTRKERADGGANSHGMTKDEREDRNHQMQEEINRLCADGHTYANAQRIAGKQFSLHPDTVRNLTKNPLR